LELRLAEATRDFLRLETLDSFVNPPQVTLAVSDPRHSLAERQLRHIRHDPSAQLDGLVDRRLGGE
jgi:hypothetical protein